MTLGIFAVALSLTSPLVAALVSPIVYILGGLAIYFATVYRKKVAKNPQAIKTKKAAAGVILASFAITVSTLALLLQVLIWRSRLELISTLGPLG